LKLELNSFSLSLFQDEFSSKAPFGQARPFKSEAEEFMVESLVLSGLQISDIHGSILQVSIMPDIAAFLAGSRTFISF
jgi:hypothetical protein